MFKIPNKCNFCNSTSVTFRCSICVPSKKCASQWQAVKRWDSQSQESCVKKTIWRLRMIWNISNAYRTQLLCSLQAFLCPEPSTIILGKYSKHRKDCKTAPVGKEMLYLKTDFIYRNAFLGFVVEKVHMVKYLSKSSALSLLFAFSALWNLVIIVEFGLYL